MTEPLPFTDLPPDDQSLLLRGGRVKNTAGTYTVCRWHEIPRYDHALPHNAEAITGRRVVVDAVRSIRYRRKAARRPDPSALEKAGEDALKGYQTDAKNRPCAVRIWYLSEGGEILCTETEPMAIAGCEALISKQRGSDALHLQVVPASPKSLHAIVEAEIPGDARRKLAEVAAGPDATPRVVAAAFKKTPSKCRFVVFPSQRPEPVEVTEATEAA